MKSSAADVWALAAAYGVRVERADLGDWGRVHLVAEYDPEGRVIRLNTGACDAEAHAIAHELYHHREAIGEVGRIRNRIAREAAADAYADLLTGRA